MDNPTPMQPTSFEYDGRIGELYKIYLVNIFLGLITLGIYHFWGKTRMRRYITHSTMLLQDRFEYTGTGGQLCKGFFVALIILIVLSIPLFIAISKNEKISEKYNISESLLPAITTEESEKKEEKGLIESFIEGFKKGYQEEIARQRGETIEDKQAETQQPTTAKIEISDEDLRSLLIYNSIILFYFLFFYLYLPFVAVYGSLRYRTCNTTWRGIRGYMGGSSIIYGFVGYFHLVLNVLTLSLWVPMSDALTYKYKMKRMSFGAAAFKFAPDYGKLYASHLLTIFCALVLTGLLAIFAFVLIEKPEDALALFIIGFIVLLIFTRFWYRATLIRVNYEGMQIGNLGFTCSVTGLGLFALQIINALILILTLGFGLPITKHRRMRFFCKHMKITNPQNEIAILQGPGKIDRSGEGISSALDLDIGLF